MQPVDKHGRQISGEVCHDVVQSGCRTPVGVGHGADESSGRTDENGDEHGDNGLVTGEGRGIVTCVRVVG